MNNSPQGLNHRYELAEEIISEPKDGSIEMIQLQEKKKEQDKMNKASDACGTPSNIPTFT